MPAPLSERVIYPRELAGFEAAAGGSSSWTEPPFTGRMEAQSLPRPPMSSATRSRVTGSSSL